MVQGIARICRVIYEFTSEFKLKGSQHQITLIKSCLVNYSDTKAVELAIGYQDETKKRR